MVDTSLFYAKLKHNLREWHMGKFTIFALVLVSATTGLAFISVMLIAALSVFNEGMKNA
jgi:hypothetical protein